MWTVADAAVASEGMGTMRQRNLNAQCEPGSGVLCVLCVQDEQDAAWDAPPCSVLSLCVVYFLSFYSIFVQLFLVFFVRLLHLSRFVWFAQKQIAGSMQMHDAAYQILFESLDLAWRLTATQRCEGVWWRGGACTWHSFALQKDLAACGSP